MEWQPQAPLITMGAGSDPDGLLPDLMNELTAAGILPERALDGGNVGSIR
jgi:hypothetical protein